MDQAELLRRVVDAFESASIAYAVTGSQASIAYGENRLTNDIDVVAALDLSNLPGFLSNFPPTDFYVSAEAARAAVAQRGQFNIIHPSSAQKIDVIVPANDFDRTVLARAKAMPTSAGDVRFVAPEELIVKKMEFYAEGGSEKHLRDITGMLLISANSIDRSLIELWAKKLGLVDVWTAVKERVERL